MKIAIGFAKIRCMPEQYPLPKENLVNEAERLISVREPSDSTFVASYPIPGVSYVSHQYTYDLFLHYPLQEKGMEVF